MIKTVPEIHIFVAQWSKEVENVLIWKALIDISCVQLAHVEKVDQCKACASVRQLLSCWWLRWLMHNMNLIYLSELR